MWKWWLTGALALAVTLIVLPDNHPDGSPQTEMGMTAAEELNMKQSILKEDQRLTDQLCRSACLRDYKKILGKLEQKQANRTELLKSALEEHPHWRDLHWISLNEPEAKWTEALDLNSKHKLLKAQYKLALDQVKKGEPYQSKPINVHGTDHFVLAIPSVQGDQALIGLVDQHILKDTHVEQKKNLRIVPYPSEHRPHMTAIDSDSYQKVEVEHPEDNEDTSHYYHGEVVVKFKTDPTSSQLKQIRDDIAAIKLEKLGYTYVFQSSNLSVDALMDYFNDQPIEYVEPHFLYMTNQQQAPNDADAAVPNDPLYTEYQWNLPIIETEAGWSYSQGSKDQIVAVIDTGVDLDHPDLRNRLTQGYDFVSENDVPDDDVGHGSHVAGVISAAVNNAEGVAGMSWYNPIMPVKVLDATGAGSTYTVAQGIIWATDHGARVINLSLGNYAEAEFLHDAIKYAFDHDVVLIAATGNDNTSSPGYPAAYPEVLAVSATDPQKMRAVFSNYGDYIDVVAPGVNIASTYMQQQYAALSGTSMASPHVAALAGMIRSVNPLLKNTEVMDIIRQTATDLGTSGRDAEFGYGQIDVKRALEAAMNTSYSISYWGKWVDQELERTLNENTANS